MSEPTADQVATAGSTYAPRSPRRRSARWPLRPVLLVDGDPLAVRRARAVRARVPRCGRKTPLVGCSSGNSGRRTRARLAQHCVREHVGGGLVEGGGALVRADGIAFARGSTSV